jgi:hypothetical protein
LTRLGDNPCDQMFCEKIAQFCPKIPQNGAIHNDICYKKWLFKMLETLWEKVAKMFISANIGRF